MPFEVFNMNMNDNLKDKDVLDENGFITKRNWKSYWRLREQDPETRREVRQEKAAQKKRLHRKTRHSNKKHLKNLRFDY